MDIDQLKRIIEGALLAAGQPLSVERIQQLFHIDERPARADIITVLEAITTDCADKGFELTEVASGYRFQIRQELSPWIARLWEEKPQKYSRALLETLALIAYQQPITRGEIEQVRGVAVSSSIMKTLLEREWVRVVGHREVPGRPAIYATTHKFLDYFNLASLDQLPTLAEIRELSDANLNLDLDNTQINNDPESEEADAASLDARESEHE
ncbi:MAG: SMC-Scp complex subunit ScpB [Pseudomonadales bacterium]|nr:SMC-Scp complex subunit ScpB [Pseudomonadales bacterium]